MIRCIVSKVLSKMLVAFLTWTVLTAVIPNYTPVQPYLSVLSNYDGYLNYQAYKLNSANIIANNVLDKDIVLVIAHPDDESMFFTPSLLELGKLDYQNRLHLVCLSNGDYDKLGNTREWELKKAARLLGFQSIEILNYEDNPKLEWDSDKIGSDLNNILFLDWKINSKQLVLLSFDEHGISSHQNHISTHYAVKNFATLHDVRMFKLITWPIWNKFTYFFLTNTELTWKYLKQWCDIDYHLQFSFAGFSYDDSSFVIYSDFNNWFVSLSTMTHAHYSQLVWFRFFWISFSRYMNVNELKLVA